MQILLVRHGESEDDLVNAYGGWSDFPLTENGHKQIEETASKIARMDIKFQEIYSSPLKRAISTSEIIAKKLGLEVEIFEYLKERNTYGILSGMNKDNAKKKYPDQVQKLDDGEYVDGSERIEDTRARAQKAIDLLKAKEEDNIIAVTHGNMLKELLPLLVGKKLTKKEDGGYILIEIENNNIKVIEFSGIEIEN